jgi:hypothetical protein
VVSMDILISLAPVALFAIAVAVTYYRFRDNFSDLASATDSKQEQYLLDRRGCDLCGCHGCSGMVVLPRPWVETVLSVLLLLLHNSLLLLSQAACQLLPLHCTLEHEGYGTIYGVGDRSRPLPCSQLA